MRKITADYIFPVTSKPLKNGIITVDNQGQIIDIVDIQGKIREIANLEHYNGVIVPGFINSHCHLELSYFKNLKPVVFDGLPGFIKNIVTLRNQPEHVQKEALIEADREMYTNGIVAVGDICNSSVSFNTKANSKISYYSFLEIFSMGKLGIEEIIKRANILQQEANDLNLPCSIVPHAPYSVPPQLFEFIKQTYHDKNQIFSVHNQETLSENDFFIEKSGALYEMFASWGNDLMVYPQTGLSSLESTAKYFPENHSKLLIHNTFSEKNDIIFLKEKLQSVTMVLCPNSNLIIENKLPDISTIIESGLNVALGTDSYSSNRQLSILDEMLVLMENFQKIDFNTILAMATINGAKALNISEKIGSIEIGKTPGLNLLSNFDYINKKPTKHSKVKVLLPQS